MLRQNHTSQGSRNVQKQINISTRRPASVRGGRTVLNSSNTPRLNTSMNLQDQAQKLKDAVSMRSSTTKNLLLATKQRQKKPAYLQSLNESEKVENFKIIDNMNKKISYLKNPRYKTSKVPILMTKAISTSKEINQAAKEAMVVVEPSVVQFVDYQVNGVYEIPVKITNISSIQRRIKYIPPMTKNFTVHRVKFPNINHGDLAPGMSIQLAVTFQAPSFADFDDFITIVTEENSFKIPLKARREPPVINLVNPMNCLNSWIGDRVDMAFRCVNNGGDGGFKFFCEKDEDDNKQGGDNDAIKIQSFTLTPSEFYLYSGHAIDIYVSFEPKKAGTNEEYLVLACDNQTSQFYTLTGKGCMLDLEITAVDKKEVNFQKNPFSTIYFENTNPTSETKRTITVKNTSLIMVPYHWAVYRDKNQSEIQLAESEQTHYRVEPSQGKIQPGESQDFEIFFCPDHAEPYYEFVDMIVEDIPISSVRNPPLALKDFADKNTPKNSKVPMPPYVGSNTQFMDIPMFNFSLRGQGNSCKVQVVPPVAFIEGDSFVNHQYSKKVSLKKMSDGVVKYALRLEGKNKSAFNVDIISEDGQQLSQQEDGAIRGIIKDTDNIELNIIVSSTEVGKCNAYFHVEIEDGAPISFQIQANFRGPILEISDPVIDIGLSKVNTRRQKTFEIENKSPIAAMFIIKSTQNKAMTLENAHLTSKQQMLLDSSVGSNRSSFIVGKEIKTRLGNKINFDVFSAEIPPFEKVEIQIDLQCIKQESVNSYFEVMIMHSDPLFFQLIGEIQVPKVMLNREEVNLGRIYAGVKETIGDQAPKYETQQVTLTNYGNLPVRYRWIEQNDQKKIITKFQPVKGIIQPKQEIQITFEVTVFTGGKIDELILCNVDDLELPLGFILTADAFGLNVAYLTNDKQNMVPQTPQIEEINASAIEPATDDMHPPTPTNLLRMLNFTQCSINKPSTQKFTLKNLSGISTKFSFGSVQFEPPSHVAPQYKSEIQKAMEIQQQLEREQAEKQRARRQTKTGKQLRFNITASSKGSNMKSTSSHRMKAILSDEHEQTQKFSSATGNTFTQTKKFEKDQNFFLSNNKGLAIVFSPHEGELPPNSEVPISVSVYNNVCGKFDDQIFCQVQGLEKVHFPIRVNISGSPVVIPQNQVGLNYNTVPATLPMPTIIANSKSISKTFKIKNTGIKSIQVDWRIFDQKDLQKITNDYFEINLIKNNSFDKEQNPYKFNFTALEPEESTNSPYTIEPKSLCVPPRSVEKFTVTFNPSQGVGCFQSIILATPDLAQEELEICDELKKPKKGSLGNIALNLLANTIYPELSIDKSLKLDGQKHIKMKYWSVPDLQGAPSSVQKLIFTNEAKADLQFEFKTTGPFEIIKTQSNTGAVHPKSILKLDQEKKLKQKMKKEQLDDDVQKSPRKQSTTSKNNQQLVETRFTLQPQKIVEVSVRFTTPAPQLTEQWPMIMKNKHSGSLMAHFSNGHQQNLFIDGFLLRPKIVLLTEKESLNEKAQHELDFGICNVDMHRNMNLYLSNITEVTAKWRLNYVNFGKKATIGYNTTTVWEKENIDKTDDPDVWEFSVAEGTLKGKSYPLRKVPEGLMVPPLPKDEEQRLYLPQKIQVNFRPKQNVLYKSKFKFTVENGLSCSVILKGRGSYEENHD